MGFFSEYLQFLFFHYYYGIHTTNTHTHLYRKANLVIEFRKMMAEIFAKFILNNGCMKYNIQCENLNTALLSRAHKAIKHIAKRNQLRFPSHFLRKQF